MTCPFCHPEDNFPKEKVLFSTYNWIAVYDGYPVTDGHVLLIPKGHYETYFDLPDSLKESMHYAVERVKAILDAKHKPNGYNIGCNCGEAAGQSIMHFHLHIIPRYKGDVENPRGGVRGVIPNKQNYG